MSRPILDLPTHLPFQTEIPVRVADLNYGGHVGNDSVLTIMQEGRTLFYRSLGFKSEIGLDGDIGQIVTDALVLYKSESFLGDVLVVRIGVDSVERHSFNMYYLITNKDTGREVARGKTGIVCFDYEKRKVAAIPQVLRTRLTE